MFNNRRETVTKTLNIEMNKATQFDVVQMIMEMLCKEEVTVALNDLKEEKNIKV